MRIVFRAPICLLFCCPFLFGSLKAQLPDWAAFTGFSKEERLRFVRAFDFVGLDTLELDPVTARMTAIAIEKKDARSEFLLKYRRFYERERLKWPPAEVRAAEAGLERIADENDWPAELVVARHYANFEDFYAGKRSREQHFVDVLHTWAEIERQGREPFADYDPEAILNHVAGALLELNDFERAKNCLLLAEKLIRPTPAGSFHYTLILNRLQTCFQQTGDLQNAIERARKIVAFNEKMALEGPADQRWRFIFWQGLGLLDMANMFISQGNLAEAEICAERGWALSQVADSKNRNSFTPIQSEFDALQVLLSIRLKTGKMGEIEPLLQRSETLHFRLKKDPWPDPMRELRFLKNRAVFFEMTGRAGEALRFSKAAKTLEDSINRQSDARKFARIQQRLDAEKFQEKISLVENERQLQVWLRNAALVILLLTLALGWAQFSRVKARRRLAENELREANEKLDSITAGFQEKSALIERMRTEIEKVATTDEREKLHAELSHHAILTNDDWAHFRQLFEKVHPGFIDELTGRMPGITAAELRLSVFEKLGLSDHEMANLLGISYASVQQTRWRLRKKKAEG